MSQPRPSIRTVAWTSDCACSDYGPCVYHKSNLDEMPERPSDEFLINKAIEILAAKETTPKNATWVWYECGCKEGIGIPIDKVCRIHNKTVIKWTTVVSLAAPPEGPAWIDVT